VLRLRCGRWGFDLRGEGVWRLFEGGAFGVWEMDIGMEQALGLAWMTWGHGDAAYSND
jgi:hypothetical protein